MHHKNSLDLAVIGNCSFSALIDKQAQVVWSCMPHFDGDSVFCSLVNGDQEENHAKESYGFWDFLLTDFEKAEQRYLPNTAVLETRLYDSHGNVMKVIDLAPRYNHYGRFVKPSIICRIIEPVIGAPKLRVRLRPRFNYGGTEPGVTRGGNHIRFTSTDLSLRLSTDAPLTYIQKETEFMLDKKYTFVFGPDEPLRSNIESTGSKFFHNTVSYWREFTRNLAVPFEWQEEIIRSAITLKMCTFEETGAVIAAMTTSIPESANTERNWDYRYCWLRDSLFVINALNRLGTTKLMEDYLGYIMNVVVTAQDHKLQPLYGISMETVIEEFEAPALKGYQEMGPVRIGNQAYVQQQNDVWGSVILALRQAFFDRRLTRPGTLDDFHRLEKLGEQAVQNFDKPDAGIWEFRGFGRIHTFSAMMCWVSADRLAKIAKRFDLMERAQYWRKHADHMHKVIMERAWSEKKQSFVDPFDSDDLDASLLLMHEVRFIDAKDPKFVKTIEAIERELMQDGLLYRYRIEDDFGKPEVAFTICTFWYIDALAASGRVKEAREKFEWLLTKRNHVGLLSEDMRFDNHELWGNFPQTYSMVGLINSAMRLSKSWHDAL